MITAFSTPHYRSSRDKELSRLLEKIRDKLELSKGIWSEYLGVSTEQYEKVLNHETPLSAVSLFHLSERLGLNPSMIESGKIDFAALLEVSRGNFTYLNPDYLVAASSRKFTVVNTLNYVEKYRGKHLRIAASRQLQIHEDFWSDWEDPASQRISIKLIGDLWGFLRSRGLRDEDFQAIGFHSVFTHRHTQIGAALSSLSAPEKVYECLVQELVETFERNHFYRITRLTGSTCIIESRSNPAVAEALRTKETGSIEGCQFKVGLLRSMPTFIGHPAAAVHETRCVHRGDANCVFFCDFSAPSPDKSFERRLSLLSRSE